MGKKYAGIHFKRDDIQPIVKITLTNTTTNEIVIDGQYIDLYINIASASSLYEDFIYWVTLPDPNANYEFEVDDSEGFYNADISTATLTEPTYILSESLEDSAIETTLTVYDSVNSSDKYTYTLTNNDITSLAVSKEFTVDGSIEDFEIGESDEHANEFFKFSVDNELSWLYPENHNITWGNNRPDYNNEVINEDGHFTVHFITPPSPLSGYATISNSGNLTAFMATTVPALASLTDYSLDININNTGFDTVSFSILDIDDWNDVCANLETALQLVTASTETVKIYDNKIKVSSAITGTTSSIIITDGSSGTPFLAAITALGTDYASTIDIPFAGTNTINIQYIPKYDKAQLLTTLKYPTDGEITNPFKDLTGELKISDYALEFIG